MATANNLPRTRFVAAYSRCEPARVTHLSGASCTRFSHHSIGAFLLEHLLSNFEALKGPAATVRR